MNTGTMIITGILLAAALFYMGWKLREWYLRDSERYTRKWVENVESTNDDKKLADMGGLGTSRAWEYFGYRPLRDQARQQAAIEKYSKACDRYVAKIKEQREADLTRRLRSEAEHRAQEWMKLNTPWGRAAYLVHGSHHYHNELIDTNIAYGTPREEMSTLFTALMEDTLTQARSGNAQALRGYMIVMEHSLLRQFCRGYAVKTPSYPADWNDLVVWLIEAPVRSDFKHVPDWAVAEAGLRAAEALRIRDFMLAKLVLAHCNVSRSTSHNREFYPFREAIGDVTLDQLHRMVEAMHLEKQLFRQELEA